MTKHSIRERLNRATERVEDGFTAAFGARHNPMHQLGALSIFFFWIVLISGIYLFIFYNTTLGGAYDSLERITHDHWWHAGIMRSLHRYAAGAAVITIILHLSREFLRDRYWGFRWYSWFSGVPLLWMLFIFGITGYWMVWDQLAQYVALSTAELLDVLPIFSEPMARNFILEDVLTERFFTLMAFIHLVGMPIVMVLGLWFHMLRITRPRIHPSRTLVLGTMAALLVLSLVHPAVSQAPADMGTVPGQVSINWLYLAIYPIMDATSPHFVWTVILGLSILLSVLPWITFRRQEPVAVVRLDNCSGCGFCADDCPYGAIDLLHFAGSGKARQAQVDPALCASCGICTGSCPSSSPFRNVSPLVSGIEMPQAPMEGIKQRIERALGSVRNENVRILVVGCEHSVDVNRLSRPGVAPLALQCTGMMPPSTLDHAFRSGGADGILVTGCECDDCHFRWGNRWMEDRLDGERPPYFSGRNHRNRIRTVWTKSVGMSKVQQELDNLIRETAAGKGRA